MWCHGGENWRCNLLIHFTCVNGAGADSLFFRVWLLLWNVVDMQKGPGVGFRLLELVRALVIAAAMCHELK